jgi:hypothetical protein
MGFGNVTKTLHKILLIYQWQFFSVLIFQMQGKIVANLHVIDGLLNILDIIVDFLLPVGPE